MPVVFVPIEEVPFVTTIGNRACITDLVIEEHFGPEQKAWVRANCKRHPQADVWLLPLPPENA